jgi:hypothetical protein
MIQFQEWPKIPRLNRVATITEKIDGDNGAIHIVPVSDQDLVGYYWATQTTYWSGEEYYIGAQSRSRLITPSDDNKGFAQWVQKYRGELIEALGPGVHFGEWWGSGIRRGYGLKNGEKRFSLFNTKRWTQPYLDREFENVPGLKVVPILHEGEFNTHIVKFYLKKLEIWGSFVAPGYMNPEGVVVYHSAANSMFKATIHGDAKPKG